MALLCFSGLELKLVHFISIVVCVLSMLGSLLIILSYIVFKKTLRSGVRLILVHISIMDFGVGFANLFGIVYGYESHLSNTNSSSQLTGSALYVCNTQAFFAIWCTYASIIWTILLSVYLYLLIAHQHSLFTRHAFLPFYVLGYGGPLILIVWLYCTNRIGYAPFDTAGWCGVTFTNYKGQEPKLYVTALGYDLWIYLSFVLVPVLCVAVHLRIERRYVMS